MSVGKSTYQPDSVVCSVCHTYRRRMCAAVADRTRCPGIRASPNSGLYRDREAAVRHLTPERAAGPFSLGGFDIARSGRASASDGVSAAIARGDEPGVKALVFVPIPQRSGSTSEKNMKIAQIAPLMESVPPRLYGGTERVVSYLTDELVRMGHDVTLFASGDSVSGANLVRCVPTASRLDAKVSDPIPYYMLMLDRVRELADEFDILHFHIDQFHFPLFRPMAHRTVTTLHGRQDLYDLKPLYVGFSDMPLVAISNAQRELIAKANLVATVHHGIPVHLLKPTYAFPGLPAPPAPLRWPPASDPGRRP